MSYATFYVLLIIIPVITVFLLSNNPKPPVGLLVLAGTYIVVYGFGGLYTAYEYESDVSEIGLTYIRVDSSIIFGFFATTASFFLAVLGYISAKKLRMTRFASYLRFNVATFHATTVLSVLSLYIYVTQYGGLSNALKMTALIRAGYYEEPSGSLTFFKYFIPLIIFSISGYLALFLKEKKKIHLFLFIISLFFAVYAFIFMGGRTRIVGVVLISFLVYFYYQRKVFNLRSIFFVFLSLVLVGPVVTNGKQFFSNLSKSENNFSSFETDHFGTSNLLSSVAGYFSHRIYGTEMAIQNFHHSNKVEGLGDVIHAPLFFIPEKITGIKKPDSISYTATEYLTGVYDSMMPPGIVAYGLYGAWLPGLILISFFFGWFFGLADKVMLVAGRDSLIFGVPFVFYWGLYGSTGDVRIIVNSMVFFGFYLVIIKLFGKRPFSDEVF